ncbi:MAG: cobalamin biosynthesis protein CbiA [Desulfobacteraceae bacterium]
MNIRISGVIILVGNYGSGKTEVAINLAIDQKRRGHQVRVADLDLVNPYFRTRQARQVLNKLGIEVVLPPEHLLHADLPILTPQVSGMIQHPDGVAILDVGGDDVGATVLAALADVIKNLDPQPRMLQVVNPYRPNTDTVEGCLQVRRAIEASARLPVSGWVGNANMMDETTLNDIRFGYDFLQRLEAASGLPLEWITASPAVLPEPEQSEFGCPVLPIHRQLVPPWKKANALIS